MSSVKADRSSGMEMRRVIWWLTSSSASPLSVVSRLMTTSAAAVWSLGEMVTVAGVVI